MAPDSKKVGPQAHKPKTKIEPRHKVVKFGELYLPPPGVTYDEIHHDPYKFLHQRMDLVISKGDIPVGFLAYMDLNEGYPLFLETRVGDRPENGPQYQASWTKEREVIGTSIQTPEGWYEDLDELWTTTLAHFERKSLLSEESLQYLDADPYVLFGVNDPITQQALQKLKDTPALLCEDSQPKQDEWAKYLRIDLKREKKMAWLVQAFAETELPRPWTCYKGIGSIVCYIRSDTGLVQWKHPFYDHFKQLREFCRQASAEEVQQVRVNRLLWSYEATRVETEHDQDPLISPINISRLADIFGYDVKTEGYVVRNLKAQLKQFAGEYRKKQNVEIDGIMECADLLTLDKKKFGEMQEHWGSKLGDSAEFELNALSNGEIDCVNCKRTALCFCLECKDYLCMNCFELLHNKGARLQHAPFRLLPCSNCVDKPAKLHCTFTDKSLCHRCYALDHIKTLPQDGKENQPRRIDYLQQYCRYAEVASERQKLLDNRESAKNNKKDSEPDSFEAVLSTDWHPFYDVRGVKFYHNFFTAERMRQSPRRVPNENDPGVPDDNVLNELKMKRQSGEKNPPVPLDGFNSLRSEKPAVELAAEEFEKEGDKRQLKAPYRTHMPNDVSAVAPVAAPAQEVVDED